MAIMTTREAADLDNTLEESGWDSDYVKQSCLGNFQEQSLGLLRGDYKLVKVDRVVDCDVSPPVPKGHKIVKHIKGGRLRWKDFCFKIIKGYDIYRNERALDKKVLMPHFLCSKSIPNVNLLNYLLEFPHLIPREWNGTIPFWGTIFKNGDDIYYVACLDAEGLPCSSSGRRNFRQYNLRVSECIDYNYNHLVLL